MKTGATNQRPLPGRQAAKGAFTIIEIAICLAEGVILEAQVDDPYLHAGAAVAARLPGVGATRDHLFASHCRWQGFEWRPHSHHSGLGGQRFDLPLLPER